MDISAGEFVVWIVVGLIAGQFVGWLMTGKKEGFGWFLNLVAGLVGGIVGGFLFKKLIGLDFGMSTVTISLQDVVCAVLGTVLVVVGAKLVKKKKA